MSPPPKSMGGLFSLKKAFHGGTNFFGHFFFFFFFLGGGGVLLHMGSNYQIMEGGEKSFTNPFSSNLNSVDLKIFLGYGGRYT